MIAAAFDAELEAHRQAERAMRLLSRPGAVVEAQGLGYGVRLGPSRRRSVMLRLDETAFQVLVSRTTDVLPSPPTICKPTVSNAHNKEQEKKTEPPSLPQSCSSQTAARPPTMTKISNEGTQRKILQSP